MTHVTTVPGTADEVRAVNRRLDDQLVALSGRLDPTQLHVAPPPPAGEDEAWTAGQVLAHLSEFPHYFARELRRWKADSAAPVGRTHADSERLAAVAETELRSLADLVPAVTSAFDDLATALDTLTDADLTATTMNRRYGPEPLTAFLDRYVLSHKAGHLDQLARTPAGRRT